MLYLKLLFLGKKSIPAAIKEEKEYFEKHPAYRAVSSRCGIPHLAKLLNRVLIHHIRDVVPMLKGKLLDMIAETEYELSGLGDPGIDAAEGGAQGAHLLNLFSQFANNFSDSIEGRISIN